MLFLPSILALATTAPQPLLSDPLSAPLTSPARTSAPLFQDDSDGDAFSYTFLELGITSLDSDTLPEDVDAWRGRASLGLFSMFYLFLDYASETVEVAGVDLDNESIDLGAGVHFGMGSNFDLIGEAAYLYDDTDALGNAFDGSDSGWMAFAGGRWMVLPTDNGGLELNGGFRWIERNGLLSDDQIGAWEAGGRFHFLNAFSIGADYQFLEDDSRWGLNARFSF